MRLVLTADNRLGALRDDGMVDISSVFTDVPFRSAADRMPRVIAEITNRRAAIDEIAASGERIPMPPLQAPVPRPPKLIATIGNESSGPERERLKQDMFLMSPDSVIGPGGTVILPDHDATAFYHEAELALVIGRRSKDLPADERALNALAGYTCAVDVSGRGIGRIGPSRIGSSFDTFTALGPALATVDEIADPQNLRVMSTVNGEDHQQRSTADTEFSVIETLAYISGYMTLVPGDVILYGPHHQQHVAIQDGDVITMHVAGIGELTVAVKDPLGRTWPRDTTLVAR